MIDTDKLEALAEAATPGPWEACAPGDYGDFDGNSRVICSADPDDMRRIAAVHWYERHPETEANAALIVELVNNLPAILRALREREQAVGWRAGSFTARCEAKSDFEVAGWINGIWALDFRIYNDEDDCPLPGWALTHLPTGYLTAAIMDSLANAQEIVRHIDKIGDWHFSDIDKVREKAPAMRQLRDTMPDVLKFMSPTLGPGFSYDRATDDARATLASIEGAGDE